MNKFAGKRLLVLGTSVGSVEIVNYAKNEGAYVIVTDYLPVEKSAAKKYADETAMVSTIDIDAICDFCREKKINGIFVGVSERNIVSMQKAAQKLGLPCYFTAEQWDRLENKESFHMLCKQFNIPDTELKLSDRVSDEIEFPVIVKPVDRSAAVGIHICNNRKEFDRNYADALEKSFSKRVIIEKYVVGTEFSAVYSVLNGEIRLSMIGDKHLNSVCSRLPLPELYVYPSRYIDDYMKYVNDNIIKMISSLNLINGRVIIQGVYDGKKHYVFEAGLRLEGTAVYRFVDYINGINMMKCLTDTAMLEKVDEDINKEDPFLKGKKCCIVSMLNGGGEIASIDGFDEAKDMDCVIATEKRYDVGDVVTNDGTLRLTHLRLFVVADSDEELISKIKKIRNIVHVKDTNGKEMIVNNYNLDKLRSERCE